MKKTIYLITICIVLVGCVKASHTSYSGSGFTGYQFDEPRDYCRRIASPSKLELYCPDGLIVVEFVNANGPITDILASQTITGDSEVGYAVQSTVGDAPSVVVAELKGDLSEYIETYPMLVGVGQFNDDLIMIAKGKLYNVRFADNFRIIFWTIVLSLKPTDE